MWRNGGSDGRIVALMVVLLVAGAALRTAADRGWVSFPGDGALAPDAERVDHDGDGEFEPSLAMAHYSVGDCVMWEDHSSAMVDTVTVDCDEPHRIEISGSLSLDALGDEYPDRSTWDLVTNQWCSQHNEALLGSPIDPHGTIRPTSIVPLPSSWDQGFRSVWCGLVPTVDGSDVGLGSVVRE